MHVKNSFKLLPILAAMAALSACGGSSSSSQPFQSQAVDGYVVGGTVECDGVANGLTKAAGSFNCPAGSHFSRITGGYDVGIDTVATTGTSPFTGVLGAPASAPYATPLTTLAVSLVNQAQSETSDDTSSKPVYNAALYEKALSDMAIVLGIPMEVIQANPAENVEAAKINAQVHQVTTAFAPSIDSYEHVTEAFATEIAGNIVSGASVDLSDNVSPVMTAINLILNQENSDNFLSITDLDQAIDNVSAANTAIENAESPAGVTVAAQNALINQAPVTIDRSNAVVDLYDDADQLLQNLTLTDFENPQKTDGQYNAKLYSGATRITYNSGFYEFNQDINQAVVSFGLEITSVNSGDKRSLSIVSDDIIITANKDNSASLVIGTTAANATYEIMGTDQAGIVTEAVVEANGETLHSSGDSITIDLDKINSELVKLDVDPILSSSGDFLVTLVVSGLRINERDGSVTTVSNEYTVEHGADSVTGNGIRGYISVRL